jgi:lipopolysaccharide biosynthesis glycosyltransferase
MRIFVGWDSREDLAYRVCCKSLWRYTTQPLDIFPIRQFEMREKNLYWREHDPLSSTEFSFTRFLTPYLNGYKGWALFMDCDFMWRGDVAALLDYQDNSKAVMVVKHKYKPKEVSKMDGAVQTQYPRKNWSSLMLINCDHPDVKNILTPQTVSIATGMYLHRFRWTSDENIGELPIAYNYLEGWHTKNDCPNPQAVHFTRGGPWFKDWADVEYANEWTQLAKEITDG